jgi:hypothetical protein
VRLRQPVILVQAWAICGEFADRANPTSDSVRPIHPQKSNTTETPCIQTPSSSSKPSTSASTLGRSGSTTRLRLHPHHHPSRTPRRRPPKAVIADNWGGLFNGGDDLGAAASNTTSAESVGLHDFPCDDHDLA